MTKRIIQITLVFMLLAASFASGGGAKAWSQCPAYVTVQWGDTLGGLALLCGTTVDAIRAANPGLGWYLYAGQVLYMPTGYTPPSQPPPVYYTTYTIQWGDTLGKIASRTGSSVSAILAVNPQITNASLIYTGQVINLPSGVVVPPPSYPPQPPPNYPPPSHDHSYSTLTIAYKYGMLIRDKPNGKFIQSAVNGSTWKYKPGSVMYDSKYRIWVEVKLNPPVDGRYTGWLLVTDQFGTFFTEPQIVDP